MPKRDLIVIISLFILLFILKFPTFDEPYWGDASAYVMPTALWILDHGAHPCPLGSQRSQHGGTHPPLYFNILALGMKIFGASVWVPHLINFLMAFMTLYYTYRLGLLLFGFPTSIAAVLLLFSSPVFFVEAGDLRLVTSLTAFSMAALYYAYREKLSWFLLMGCSAALIKEPGVWILPGCYLLMFIRYYRSGFIPLLKKLILYSLPVLAFLLWLWLRFFLQGRILEIVAWSFGNPTFRLYDLFINDGRWILTVFVILRIWNQGLKRKEFLKKKIFLTVVVLIGCFFLLMSFTTYQTSKCIETFLISCLVASLVIINWRNINLEILPLIAVILVNLAFLASLAEYLPQYLLPAYPAFYLLAAFSMKKTPYRLQGFVTVIVIAYSIYLLPYNQGYFSDLSYIKEIKATQKAIKFIEENFLDYSVLTCGIGDSIFREPRLGFVKKPITEIGFDYILKDINKSSRIPELFLYTANSWDGDYQKDLEKRVQILKNTGINYKPFCKVQNKILTIVIMLREDLKAPAKNELSNL